MDVPSDPKEPPQVGTDPKLRLVTAQTKTSSSSVMPRVNCTIGNNNSTTSSNNNNSTTSSNNFISNYEMIRLFSTYGSIVSTQDINGILSYTPSSPNDVSTYEHIRNSFFRGFPDLSVRFTRDRTTGRYEPNSGHEAELKYRQEMRRNLDDAVTLPSQQNNNSNTLPSQQNNNLVGAPSPPQEGTDSKLQMVTASLKPHHSSVSMPRVVGERGGSRRKSTVCGGIGGSKKLTRSSTQPSDEWHENYQNLLRFKNDGTDINQCNNLPTDAQNWVTQQRLSYKELMETGDSNVLPPDRIRLLQEIGLNLRGDVHTAKPPSTQRHPQRGATPRYLLEKKQAAAKAASKKRTPPLSDIDTSSVDKRRSQRVNPLQPQLTNRADMVKQLLSHRRAALSMIRQCRIAAEARLSTAKEDKEFHEELSLPKKRKQMELKQMELQEEDGHIDKKLKSNQPSSDDLSIGESSHVWSQNGDIGADLFDGDIFGDNLLDDNGSDDPILLDFGSVTTKLTDKDSTPGSTGEEGCKVCKKDSDHSNLLLCEHCNDEYHIYCLNPPLQSVPEGDFFCDNCKRLYGRKDDDGLDAMQSSTTLAAEKNVVEHNKNQSFPPPLHISNAFLEQVVKDAEAAELTVEELFKAEGGSKPSIIRKKAEAFFSNKEYGYTFTSEKEVTALKNYLKRTAKPYITAKLTRRKNVVEPSLFKPPCHHIKFSFNNTEEKVESSANMVTPQGDPADSTKLAPDYNTTDDRKAEDDRVGELLADQKPVAEEGTCLPRKVEEEKCTREKLKAEELRFQRKAEEKKRIEKLVAEKTALAESEKSVTEKKEQESGNLALLYEFTNKCKGLAERDRLKREEETAKRAEMARRMPAMIAAVNKMTEVTSKNAEQNTKASNPLLNETKCRGQPSENGFVPPTEPWHIGLSRGNNTTSMKENAENATNQQENTKSSPFGLSVSGSSPSPFGSVSGGGTSNTNHSKVGNNVTTKTIKVSITPQKIALLPSKDGTAFGYQNNETNQITPSSRPPIGAEENVYQIVTEGEDIGNRVMNYINLAKLDVYTLQHLRLAMNEQLSSSWHQQHPSFLFCSGKVIHPLDRENTTFVHSGEYDKKIRGADSNGDGSYDHPYVVTIVPADNKSDVTSPFPGICCVM